MASSSLPPNVYSNRPELNMPSGTLTILVIDGMNTSMTNQAYVRDQLIKYIATQHVPGQQTAIYALGSRLIKLQDFTSDPAVLLAAIAGFQPKPEPNTTSTLAPSPGSGALASTFPAEAAFVAQTLQQFTSDQTALALEIRIRTTLMAMRELARVVAGHPGRKNLVWVTAGLPFSLIPEQNQVTYEQTRAGNFGQAPVPNEISSASYGNQIQQGSADEVKQTAALLAESEVAIYPVDARGLVGATLADASRQGTNAAGLLMIGQDYGQSVSAANSRLFSSQAGMQEMAQLTGGRAFTNRNDIDHAVALASSDGSTYYSLGYYPDKKKFDGSFHKLKVSVSRPDVQLRYRPGYFSVDPSKSQNQKDREAELVSTLRDNPGATMVVFDVRVAPPPPAETVKLPVQFLVRPDTITADESKDGGRALNLDFYIAAFTRDGRLVANNGKGVNTTITADQYSQLQQKGLLMPLEISLPAGDYDLRLAVRDNHTGYIGTVSVGLKLPKPGA